MFTKNSFCQILFKITPSKHFIAEDRRMFTLVVDFSSIESIISS